MKLSKLILVASVAGSVYSSAAFAADLVAPAPDYNWTGFYAGVNGGAGFGQNNWVAQSFVGATGNGDFSGLLGGVTLGANWQKNAWIYGLEGDLDLAGLTANDPSSVSFFCGGPPAVTCNTYIDSLGTLRARVGHEVGSRAMIYATGGLAGGWLDTKLQTPIQDAGSAGQLGWTVGGGVEAHVSDHVSVKAEALYVNLGILPFSPPGVTVNTNVNFGVARVGLNYKF